MAGLFESPLFETVLGLVVVFFVAATLCAGLVELVGSMFAFRARHLWRALDRALSPPTKPPNLAIVDAAKLTVRVKTAANSTLETFANKLPNVTPAKIGRVKQIPGADAAQALVATRQQSVSDFSLTHLGQLVDALPASVRTSPERLRDWLERWFDGAMENVSVTYRRNIRWWTVVASIFVVALAGLDSLGLVQRLYDEPATRALIIAEADEIIREAQPTTTTSAAPAGDATDDTDSSTTSSSSTTTTSSTTPAQAAGTGSGEEAGTDGSGEGRGEDGTPVECTKTQFNDRLTCVKEVAADLSGLRVSMWQIPEERRPAIWRMGLGLAITIGAIAAGAPFWFDVLRRMMGLRRGSSGSS